MGGAVGLKGTDGLVERARALGASPVSPGRALAALKILSREGPDALFLTASGSMGEDLLRECGLHYVVAYQAPPNSSSRDTGAAVSAFLEQGAELILFCGGDGTARDVAAAASAQGRTDVPLLGIPAGVKMHSGVFAVSPEAAAELALRYLRGELRCRETEIADVDEELYRRGRLETSLYGIARTPYFPALVQERKRVYSSGDEEQFKEEIAAFAREFMRDGSVYILGAGSTTSAIAGMLGLEKTLLGVDVIRNGELLLRDASEKDLLAMMDWLQADGSKTEARIIVSPIGAQGFVLGRGSQQISAEVVRRAGPENLIMVATPHKLRELPYLLVDTGDPGVDQALSGSKLVVCGYRLAQRKEVQAAGKVR
ncbi:MAG: ATP-NAD kinase family protein [Methanosarcinales archaeon]|nr:ATP-NAD kinase family protein [Methanosarcinales archaeon]